jgi:glycosyltransferase involved in cell wall biosynthesis
MEKLPISALVASYNEGHLLQDCLESLQFCDEIFFVDLGSTDQSIDIANKIATKTVQFHHVSRIEEIHPIFIPQLKNEWFILIDPDERILPELALDIKKIVQEAEPELAMVRVPMFYYFKNKLLKGTVYGGLIYARLLFNRKGIKVNSDVHANILLKEGFSRRKIAYTENNFDQHFWCNSWAHLLDKQRRYLLGEGQAQYNSGKRYSRSTQWKCTLIKFYFSYKGKQGYLDGFRGFLLSLLAARYEFLSWSELRKYEKIIGFSRE